MTRRDLDSPADALVPPSSQEMPDIDSADHENPLAVTEYVNDIFSYWFRVEVRAHARLPLKIINH
jgi:hypothetical protein